MRAAAPSARGQQTLPVAPNTLPALSAALLSSSLSVQDVGESWGWGSSGLRPLSPGPSWWCQSRGTSKEEVGSGGPCICLGSNPQGPWSQGCGTPATWAAEVGEAPPQREPRLHRPKGDGLSPQQDLSVGVSSWQPLPWPSAQSLSPVTSGVGPPACSSPSTSLPTPQALALF